MDQLIVSINQSDRGQLESALGPEARRALDHAVEARSWEAILQEIWHRQPGVKSAVGYRFDIQGPWSQPEETLDEAKGNLVTPISSDGFTLDTQFTSRAGKECARYTVNFRRVPEQPGVSKYLIDNADIEDLLRSIAACASQ
jgi:hypothetical protein